jgi:hypothetical protein
MEELAPIVVQLLVANFTGRLEAFAGEEPVGALRDRLEVLVQRLGESQDASESQYASDTLERLRKDPENPRRQDVLENLLRERLTADPEFGDLVAELADVETTPGSVKIRGQDITVRGSGQGTVWSGRLPGDSDEEY